MNEYPTGGESMGMGAVGSEMEPMPQQQPAMEPALPPGVALTQVQSLTRKAIDARRSTIGEKWRLHRALYNNQFDWSGKRKDQSQHPVAELARAVDWKAQALIDALVSNTKDPFDLDPQTDLADLVAPIYQACISANLDQEDFPTLLHDNLVSGMLTSGCVFRCYPDPDKDPASGYSKIEIDVMERVFRDPTGRNKWRLRIAPYDLVDVQRMAEKQGWDAGQVELCGQGATPESELWRNEAGDLVAYAATEQDGYRGTVFLTEYWGPVWEYEGGPIAYPFAKVVLADNQYELLVQSDPYGDGKGDLLDADLSPRATFPYGKSSVEDCAPMAELGTRVLNSIADNIAKSTAHYNEINEDLFTQDTAKVLKGSVKSSQSIPKHGQGDLIKSKPLAIPNPMALEFYGLVDSKFQKYSSAADETMGMESVDSKGAPGTATASRIRQGNAALGLKGMGRSTETRVIRPLIERMLYYLVTYGDLGSEWIQRIASKEIKAARERIMKELLQKDPPDIGQPPIPPPMEGVGPDGLPAQAPDESDPGYQMMNQVYQMQARQAMQAWEQRAMAFAEQKLQKAWREPCAVRVRGISGVLEREGRNEVLQSVVGAIGGMDPTLIDVPKVALTLCRNAGIHAGDILVSDSEDELRQTVEQNQKMRQEQAMAQAQAAPQQDGNGKPQERAKPKAKAKQPKGVIQTPTGKVPALTRG